MGDAPSLSKLACQLGALGYQQEVADPFTTFSKHPQTKSTNKKKNIRSLLSSATAVSNIRPSLVTEQPGFNETAVMPLLAYSKSKSSENPNATNLVILYPQ